MRTLGPWKLPCYIKFLITSGYKTKKYEELGPAKLPCSKRILLYIRPLYNDVPLYLEHELRLSMTDYKLSHIPWAWAETQYNWLYELTLSMTACLGLTLSMISEPMKMTKTYSAMTSSGFSMLILRWGLSYIMEIQVPLVTRMEHHVMYVTMARKSL